MIMLGEYYATLCNKHLNEWDEFIKSLPIYREYMVEDAQGLAAVYGGDGDIKALIEKRLVLVAKLHDIAATWMAERRVDRKSEF